MKKINASYFIFDMDGLMVDSENAIYKIWQQLMQQDGIALPFSFYQNLIGIPDEEMEAHFKKEYGEDFNYNYYNAKYLELKYSDAYYEKIDAKKGVHALLAHLKQKGYTTAVATSSKKEMMQKLLTKHDLYRFLDYHISFEDTQAHKPEPDVFLKALEKGGFCAEQAVVLEDSINGLKAAHRAKIRSIFIKDLIEPDQDTLSTVFLRVKSLDDLIPLCD